MQSESPDVIPWLAANVDRLHSMSSEAELRVAASELSEVLMFDSALMLVARVAGGRVRISDLVSWNCPSDSVPPTQTSIAISSFPTAARWLAERRPLFIPAQPRCADAGRLNHPRNKAVHGVLDISGTAGSYFAFSGLPSCAGRWIGPQLRMVVPHLHCALMRVFRFKQDDRKDALTPRERSLIEHVSNGLSNAEIAEAWCRSSATVRNTMHRLMKKLGTQNRFTLLVEARDRHLL